MKKIFTSLIVATLVLLSGTNQSFALTRNKSYEAAKDIYSEMDEFKYADNIIACEALGLETDDKPIVDSSVIETTEASKIAKAIIALSLHGDNPNNYKGTNYVKMLEDCVHEDGIYLAGETDLDANKYAYDVFALYVVDSEKLNAATEILAKSVHESGIFGYQYEGYPYDDLSTTGWAIEALTLVNQDKYKSLIDNSIEVIKNNYMNDEAGFDLWGYGADANTQACMLMGLLTYDADGVKDSTYNKNNNNPYDQLLSFQFEDGSFWISDWETGEHVYNSLATAQGCQAIGYYYNGSVYQDAKEEYSHIPQSIDLNYKNKTLTEGDTLTLSVQFTPNSSSLPLKWTVDNKEILSINDQGVVKALKEGTATVKVTTESGLEASCQIVVKKKEVVIKQETTEEKPNHDKTTVEKTTTQPKTTTPSKTTKTITKSKIVETSDNNYVELSIVVMIGSAVLYLALRKKNEENI